MTARDGNAVPRSSTGGRNRVWRYAWRITAGLFVILFVTLLAFSFDDELLDTSALRYEPRQIPDAENAYLLVADATRRLGPIDEFDTAGFDDAVSGANWDEVEVSEWLRDRDHAIEAIRKLGSFHRAQFTLSTDLEITLGLPPTIHLPAYLAALRSRQLQRSNEYSAATALLLDCFHAADLMEQSRGDALHYLYSLRIHTVACDVASTLISDPRTPADDLIRLREHLTVSRPASDTFAQMLAAEYRKAELLVRVLPRPDQWPKNWGHPSGQRFTYRLPFLFKPNQTLNYIIPHTTRLGTAIDLPLDERKALALSGPAAHGFLCEQYDDWINRDGKRLAHDGLLPTLSAVLDHRLRQQTRISLAETLIALRLYHDANDREFPASLAELVPAYLPAVPRDYFDGEPIKYSRELRAIWSAGPEGDFRLADADQAVDERELILPLCFDGSYLPWPRRDPNARPPYSDENESGEPSESPPHTAAN